MNKAPQGPANVYFGGQAVLEGVMIRGPEHMAVAVRHPNGHIVRHSERLSSIYTGALRKVPFVRGMIVLAETMTLGMRALSYSSKIAFESTGEDGDGKDTEFPATAFWGSMVLALAFVIGIFVVGPILLSHILNAFNANRVIIVAVEGILRLGLFVAYIALIGLMPDIRRVFQYHGAEHMTIHAYEAGAPLTVAGVRPFPKEHTRCGTSFLLVVVVVAFLTFFVFDVFIDRGLIVRFASRIVLVPFVAGVSYEILRIGARFGRNPVVHAMFAPNIALQALTTKVPDDSQIEVAIASFEATLEAARVVAPAQLATDVAVLEAAPPLD
ncbi:MAG: DUF1385 domain-containing protein [Chloroflexi bacterium]|nr:DUF1385 domain-containing protein [Chloroflexota bacterium]